jgi:hypothetical protein
MMLLFWIKVFSTIKIFLEDYLTLCSDFKNRFVTLRTHQH